MSLGNSLSPRAHPVPVFLQDIQNTQSESQQKRLGSHLNIFSSSAIRRKRNGKHAKIEPGESLEEVMRSETWEETGIKVGEALSHDLDSSKLKRSD
ncbi:hypothetical protein HN51_007176 [Arachis hypogaea]